jgi:hypothetical protein
MATTTIPVIDDQDFTGADKGLALPVRRLADGTLSLKITGLDRADPPQYSPGGVPRAPTFNANVLSLQVAPAMPQIKVACTLAGFTPSARTPIFWRVQTLHVPGRFMRKGPKQIAKYYSGRYPGCSLPHSIEFYEPAPARLAWLPGKNTRGCRALVPQTVMANGVAVTQPLMEVGVHEAFQ